MKKRLFDLVLVSILMVLVSPLFLLTWCLVKATSSGPALYWSKRVGVNNQLFEMPKFRTMRTNTPSLATHLLQNPEQYLTPVGSFLRKSSLDELPQLWSVLTGDMSLVGPRPALYNQYDLIELRTNNGVSQLLPGITGWAQVNGRDELPIPEKVALDFVYKQKQGVYFDGVILLKTLQKVLSSENVNH